MNWMCEIEVREVFRALLKTVIIFYKEVVLSKIYVGLVLVLGLCLMVLVVLLFDVLVVNFNVVLLSLIDCIEAYDEYVVDRALVLFIFFECVMYSIMVL